MRIWLDDVRPAPDGWVWVKNARELIDMINVACRNKLKGVSPVEIEEISLDHDLGDGVPTGYTVVTHIEYLVHAVPKYQPPKLRIHSANPVGRKNMMAAIAAIARHTN